MLTGLRFLPLNNSLLCRNSPLQGSYIPPDLDSWSNPGHWHTSTAASGESQGAENMMKLSVFHSKIEQLQKQRRDHCYMSFRNNIIQTALWKGIMHTRFLNDNNLFFCLKFAVNPKWCFYQYITHHTFHAHIIDAAHVYNKLYLIGHKQCYFCLKMYCMLFSISFLLTFHLQIRLLIFILIFKIMEVSGTNAFYLLSTG